MLVYKEFNLAPLNGTHVISEVSNGSFFTHKILKFNPVHLGALHTKV